jgi:hypothetical protein
MSSVLGALSLSLVIAQAGSSAATDAALDLSAVCALEVTDEGGLSNFLIELLVSNGGDADVFDVTPGGLGATSTGTAVLFVKANPQPLAVLAPGATAAFHWSGQAFGDGTVEVGTSLTARRADGSDARIESIDCVAAVIGTPHPTSPRPSRTPHQHRTLAPSATATPERIERCPGDCDRSGTVQIHELVTAIEIAIGRADVSACPAADADGNSQIEVSELTAGVGSSLFGCSVP